MSYCPQNRLLLFTRYPQVGKTKTRLIPKLGAIGAADLQRQMTEYIVNKLYDLSCQGSDVSGNARSEDGNFSLVIHFTDASVGEMQSWLGAHLTYRAQVNGNLGRRLLTGFQQSFEEGCDASLERLHLCVSHGPWAIRSSANGPVRILAIGSDCPEMGNEQIQQALAALQTHDVVLGPAQDGGYYLIGLRQPWQALFHNIDWGTSVVFQQTQAQVRRLGLSLAVLAPLSDIDRPEDLIIWERLIQAQTPLQQTL